MGLCLPLFLEFLVVLAGEVTAHKGLHPSDNLAETVITELLHGTQNSGTEEHLRVFGQVSSPCGKCADVDSFAFLPMKRMDTRLGRHAHAIVLVYIYTLL